MRRRLQVLARFIRALSLFGLAALVSCKSKAGAKCDDMRRAVCEDDGSVLSCQGGVLVSSRCRGPNHCQKLGNNVTCDDSIAEEGDACLLTDSENHACSADKKRHLVCTDGKFKVVEPCRGPKACSLRGELVTCDGRLASKDDPCVRAGSFACAVDLKTRLVCKDKRMQLDRFCRGQRGCQEGDFSCDETVSGAGDPCGVPGMVACALDGRQELVCQGGQYIAQRQCKKMGCRVTPTRGIDCQ